MANVHANWRYFEMYDDNGNVINSWFGGGQDLTPYYFIQRNSFSPNSKRLVISTIQILSQV
jgi:coproporphyrinogen III oxidase